MRLRISINGKEEVQESDNEKVILGRGEACDIRVIANGVSRKHLAVEQRGSKYFVQDLGSTNGSKIGEEKIPTDDWMEFTSLLPVELAPEVLVYLVQAILLEENHDDEGTQMRVRRKLDEKMAKRKKEKEKAKKKEK